MGVLLCLVRVWVSCFARVLLCPLLFYFSCAAGLSEDTTRQADVKPLDEW